MQKFVHGQVQVAHEIVNMHKLGWKAQYFKSADVSMLGHDCGVSQYPQFYDTN